MRARVTSLEKSSSWWYQFSSTALPIVITLFITAFATGAIYNSRFEGLEKRVYNLEKDVRQIMVTQSAMQKSIELIGKDIQEIKEILKEKEIMKEKEGEKLSDRQREDSTHKRKTVSM